MTSIKPIYQLLIFLFYFGFSFYIQRDTIYEYPHHIHAWAHHDHYALSKGFLNNQFDFFHPETLTANKQFPSLHHPKQLSKTTSTDFPVVQYLAAVVMKVSGSEEPIVYRVLMLLLASLGLLYLFKIAFHFSQNAVFSLIVPVLLLFTPVYLDYQIGFLPSMAAMSFLFIGVYHYIKSKEDSNLRQLTIAVVALSLSSAIRMPFAIPLIAVMSFETLSLIRKKTRIKHLLIIVSGFLLPVIYFFYNQYLRSEYGSIFLGSPLYARNLEELKSNFTEACTNWHYHYFGAIQWTTIFVSVLGMLTYRLLVADKFSKYKQLIDLLIIYGVGVLIYMILMSRQLVHHDYYALDTFIPFLVLVSIIAICRTIYLNKIPYFSSFVVLGGIVLSLDANLSTLNDRRAPSNSQPYTEMHEDYSHLKEILIKNEISNDKELLVLDPFAPNMPFALSGYTGANLMSFEHYEINEVFTWPYDYIILRDDWFYEDYWGINWFLLQQTQVVDYSNGIFILERSPTKGESLFHWFNVDASKPQKSILNYETIQDIKLINGIGTCSSEFAMTYRDTLSDSPYHLMTLSCQLNKTDDTEAFWHIHIHSDNDDLFNEYIQIPSDAETLRREIILPDDLNRWYISTYLYNPNKNVIYYQDFKVKYY